MLFKHGEFLQVGAALMKVFSRFASVHLNDKFKCSECSRQTVLAARMLRCLWLSVRTSYHRKSVGSYFGLFKMPAHL